MQGSNENLLTTVNKTEEFLNNLGLWILNAQRLE